ncbi:hypothetical protein MY04_4702 [Flammeovirga sp. MY04]|uniref:hypothetical protein n=1 Tax=Flammeovirga sp. MY04 TaxID=1191459 RepID=UPI0008062D80|nr:hypothetical protein [Flammeovirga sp. MY04]ANQ52037.1 hypothetical protein MY04_4702 [Flammeovirga sp. MY04]
MNTLEQIQILNSNEQELDQEYFLKEEHYELLMDLSEAETDDEEEELFKKMKDIPNLPIISAIIELWENTVGAVVLSQELKEGNQVTMEDKMEIEEEACADMSFDYSRFTVILEGEVNRVQIVDQE